MIILLLVVASFTSSCLACDGYQLSIKSIKSCNENSIIKADQNFSTVLTKDCYVKIYGCVTNEGFKKADMNLTITESRIVRLQRKGDFCELIKDPSSKMKWLLESFGVHKKCPFEKVKVCSDGSQKIDVSKIKRFFMLSNGNEIKVETKMKHDTGVTCVQARFNLKKVK